MRGRGLETGLLAAAAVVLAGGIVAAEAGEVRSGYRTEGDAVFVEVAQEPIAAVERPAPRAPCPPAARAAGRH